MHNMLEQAEEGGGERLDGDVGPANLFVQKLERRFLVYVGYDVLITPPPKPPPFTPRPLVQKPERPGKDRHVLVYVGDLGAEPLQLPHHRLEHLD